MRNYNRYNKSNGSVTDYKELVRRNHFAPRQKTWKEDADYILDWVNRN